MILIRTLLEEGVEELRYRRHGGGGGGGEACGESGRESGGEMDRERKRELGRGRGRGRRRGRVRDFTGSACVRSAFWLGLSAFFPTASASSPLSLSSPWAAKVDAAAKARTRLPGGLQQFQVKAPGSCGVLGTSRRGAGPCRSRRPCSSSRRRAVLRSTRGWRTRRSIVASCSRRSSRDAFVGVWAGCSLAIACPLCIGQEFGRGSSSIATTRTRPKPHPQPNITRQDFQLQNHTVGTQHKTSIFSTSEPHRRIPT